MSLGMLEFKLQIASEPSRLRGAASLPLLASTTVAEAASR